MLTPQEVEAILRALGCYWGADIDDYHQLWLTSWGFAFMVPMIGPHRLCPRVELDEIVDLIKQMKP